MKKELSKDDILVIDGKEFSYNDLTRFLTERVIYKKQIESVNAIFKGDVTNEQ